MIQKLKVLGLALVAVFAMSAVAASAASAATTDGEFTAESFPTTLTGNQVGQHVFTIEDNLSTSCKKVTFHGTVNGVSTTVTVTPTFAECSAFGLASTITTNGCDYLFHLGETSGAADTYSATTDIVCPEGKSIMINSGFGQCEVSVGAQTGLGPITVTSNTAGKDLDVTTSMTGIKYTKVKDAFGCQLTGTGALSNGTYNSNTTITGEKVPPLSGAVGISITH